MNEAYLMRSIHEFSTVYLPTPSRMMTKPYFDKVSYSTWAIDEILNRLVEELYKPPPHITGRDPVPYFDIIQEFVDQMDYMAETTTDYHKRFIFLVAKETGDELLLFLKGESLWQS